MENTQRIEVIDPDRLGIWTEYVDYGVLRGECVVVARDGQGVGGNALWLRQCVSEDLACYLVDALRDREALEVIVEDGIIQAARKSDLSDAGVGVKPYLAMLAPAS